MIMMKLIPSMIALLLIGSYSTIATAQDYYDDDIYYNPSKAKTKEKKSTKANSNSNVIIVDYRFLTLQIVLSVDQHIYVIWDLELKKLKKF